MVAVSRAASLPEIVGNAGAFFDPLDVSDVRRAIEHVVSDTDLRRRMIAAGFTRASLFGWDDLAPRVSNVLGVPCFPMRAAVQPSSQSCGDTYARPAYELDRV